MSWDQLPGRCTRRLFQQYPGARLALKHCSDLRPRHADQSPRFGRPRRERSIQGRWQSRLSEKKVAGGSTSEFERNPACPCLAPVCWNCRQRSCHVLPATASTRFDTHYQPNFIFLFRGCERKTEPLVSDATAVEIRYPPLSMPFGNSEHALRDPRASARSRENRLYKVAVNRLQVPSTIVGREARRCDSRTGKTATRTISSA
jgi:hypothetical protein